MRRRLLAAAVTLGAFALAAGAVPAFTADSGSVTVSITAAPPAGACVLVSPDTVDFGTVPFSSVNSGISYASRTVSIQSCATGTIKENVAVAGTNAVGPGGTRWTLATDLAQAGCTVDFYEMRLLLGSAPSSILTNVIDTTPLNIRNGTTGLPFEWSAGQAQDFELRLGMPCAGSNGAGQTKSLSVTFTAFVP
jgi:type 1 fimbria pilin